jgi:tRNA (adenine57-N1/adenine58-N1)-methyltransferase catalytic subunit
MIGHTGFMVTARRLADGVTPPPRRRRPAKGAHGEGEAGAAGGASATEEGSATGEADTPGGPDYGNVSNVSLSWPKNAK